MHYTRMLDSQRLTGKAIFGSGFLISDRLAKQADEARRQADEARACTWELSARELEIIRTLNPTTP